MAGTLAGWLGARSGAVGAAGKELGAIRRMGAAQKLREEAALRKLGEVRKRTPAYLAGDPMAQMDLATMGVAPPPKTDAEIAREDNERAWQHQKDLDRIALAKEQEKRLTTQHKERMEESKRRADEAARRDEARTKESDRRWDILQGQREEERTSRLKTEVNVETAKSKADLATYRANRAAWEPLAKEMFPDMSESERMAQIDSLARTRGPSISEQAIPRVRAEERKARAEKEEAIDFMVKKRFPMPDLPPVAFPDTPKRVTEQDIRARLKKKDEAARALREERRKAAARGPATPRFDPMGVLFAREVGAARGEEPKPREYTDEEIRQMVQEANDANVAEWEAGMKAAQQREEKVHQVLMAYGKDIERRKQILRTVPGQLGMALAGVTEQATPQTKARASFEQAQEKERLQFNADVAEARKLAAQGNQKAKDTLKNLKSQGLID